MSRPYEVAKRPHQDLGGLALHHLTCIRHASEQPDYEGITYDCMSCLLALAFEVEALLNLAGALRVDQWAEKQPYPQKRQEVLKAVGMTADNQVLAALDELQTFRNGIAHAKPFDGIVDAPDIWAALEFGWEELATPGSCEKLYACVRRFKGELAAAAKLDGRDLTSHATSVVRHGV